MKITFVVKYSGFDVNVVSHGVDNIREFTPHQNEYEKNLFASYLYRGTMSEFRKDDDSFLQTIHGELFVDWNVTLDYSTYEKYTTDTTWLCFSSWKPYSASYLRLTKPTTIPAGVGVYNVLGKFVANDNGQQLTSKALNYIKPREYSYEIDGNAKVLLLKNDRFVNQPTT